MRSAAPNSPLGTRPRSRAALAEKPGAARSARSILIIQFCVVGRHEEAAAPFVVYSKKPCLSRFAVCIFVSNRACKAELIRAGRISQEHRIGNGGCGNDLNDMSFSALEGYGIDLLGSCGDSRRKPVVGGAAAPSDSAPLSSPSSPS